MDEDKTASKAQPRMGTKSVVGQAARAQAPRQGNRAALTEGKRERRDRPLTMEPTRQKISGRIGTGHIDRD